MLFSEAHLLLYLKQYLLHYLDSSAMFYAWFFSKILITICHTVCLLRYLVYVCLPHWKESFECCVHSCISRTKDDNWHSRHLTNILWTTKCAIIYVTQLPNVGHFGHAELLYVWCSWINFLGYIPTSESRFGHLHGSFLGGL